MNRESSGAIWPLALGTLVGLVPQFLAYSAPLRHGRAADPFDMAISYYVWLGGMFLVAAIFSFRKPETAWRCAAATGFGMPLSLPVFIALTPVLMPSLWPLAMIVCSVIGFPAAYAGAFAGSCLSRLTS